MEAEDTACQQTDRQDRKEGCSRQIVCSDALACHVPHERMALDDPLDRAQHKREASETQQRVSGPGEHLLARHRWSRVANWSLSTRGPRARLPPARPALIR